MMDEYAETPNRIGALGRSDPRELAELAARYRDRGRNAAVALSRRHRAAGELLGDAVGLSLSRAAEEVVEQLDEAADHYARALGMTRALADDERIRLTREADEQRSAKLRAVHHLQQVVADELDRRTRQARSYRRDPSFRDKAGKRLLAARRFLDEEGY